MLRNKLLMPESVTNTSDKMYTVYILKCSDGSLYTGITTDLERRVREHKEGKASKYTTAKGVERVMYTETEPNRSGASKREAEIKQLSRDEKLKLVSKN